MTINPIMPDAGPRKIEILTTSDGKEEPAVLHGGVGVTFRWARGTSVTYPWTSIFSVHEEPIPLDHEPETL